MEREFANYRLIEKLGEGAMGEVYKGLDMMLEREVAIKLLRPELGNRQDIVERFRTEAVALARLQHTNIATLYSFLPHGDQYFMVMEFVRGESLARLIEPASIANRQNQTKVQALPSEPRHLRGAPPARPGPRTTRWKNYPGVLALLVLLGLTGGLIAVVDVPQRPTPNIPTAEGEQNQTSLNPDLSKISLIEEQNAIKKPGDSALVPNLGGEEVDAILKRSPSLIPLPSLEKPLNPPEQEPPAAQRQRPREKVARRETKPARPMPKPKPPPQWEIIRGETRAVH